jgi:divalent metal cation (Fe/Co/Zn/Cd) transporter
MLRRIKIYITANNDIANREIDDLVDEFTRTIEEKCGNVEGLTVDVDDHMQEEDI